VSAAGLASAVAEAEGRTNTRRVGNARARKPDTSIAPEGALAQGGREAKPSVGPQGEPQAPTARGVSGADAQAAQIVLPVQGGRE